MMHYRPGCGGRQHGPAPRRASSLDAVAGAPKVADAQEVLGCWLSGGKALRSSPPLPEELMAGAQSSKSDPSGSAPAPLCNVWSRIVAVLCQIRARPGLGIALRIGLASGCSRESVNSYTQLPRPVRSSTLPVALPHEAIDRSGIRR